MTLQIALIIGALAAGGAQLVVLSPPNGLPRRIATAARPWSRSLALPVVIGAVLRLVWVMVATRTPQPITDPSEYLRIASELNDGVSPRFGGVGGPSAFWPPGYPAILSPFVWFSESTGWVSAAFVASLINVAVGTLTILLAGRLARLWLGMRTAPVAAWLVALCPALIYFTATAHSDTVFIALLLWLLVLIGVPTPDRPLTQWVLIGLLLGAACLVRTPALAVIMVPALALRAAGGTWRGAVRASLGVAAGAVVVLTPWLIRNGMQVGVWTPTSTNNASAVCFGHQDGAEAEWSKALNDERLRLSCFGGSPYADPRLVSVYTNQEDRAAVEGLRADDQLTDEATWYREKMADATHWALTHPKQEVVLSAEKAWATWRTEGAAVDSARNYGEPGWAGRWQTPLGTLANVWLWAVGGLALAAMIRSPRCRRATPVWVPVVTITIGVVAAFGEPHYRYPANPLIAILAAGMLCSFRNREDPADEMA